jgi:hypothetical protein
MSLIRDEESAGDLQRAQRLRSAFPGDAQAETWRTLRQCASLPAGVTDPAEWLARQALHATGDQTFTFHRLSLPDCRRRSCCMMSGVSTPQSSLDDDEGVDEDEGAG